MPSNNFRRPARKPYFDSSKQNDLPYLLSFVVKVLEFAEKTDVPLTHLQLSRLVFNDADSRLLKLVYQEYGNYFINAGAKKKINLLKLKEEQGFIWDASKKINDKLVFNQEEILRALKSEYGSVKEQLKTLRVKVSDIKLIEESNGLLIYRGRLNHESDDPIRFNEGDRLMVKSGALRHYSTTLFHDPLKSLLAFQTSNKIDFKSGFIEVGGVPSVGKLIEHISNIKVNEALPFWKLMSDPDHCQKIWDPTHPFVYHLDDSQEQAVMQALQNDITFIWGPPGTGKSHTLARLIANLYEQGERTAVTSISNVAVDSLLSKFVELADGDYRKTKRLDLLQKNEILRIGYAQSEEIRQIKQIQFDSSEISSLSAKLEILTNRIDASNNEDASLILRSQRDEVKRKLDIEVGKFLTQAKVLFLTSSKFLLDTSLKDVEFDNLIVDEGSMMNIPTLLALAQNVKKRIIVCGDFMQLGPISMSQSQSARKWLHNDLFKLIGLGPDKLPSRKSLAMLTTQRRMALDIAELVNKSFYNGRLKTASNIHHYRYKDLLHPGHIEFIEMGSGEDYKSDFSKSKSRYNKFNRAEVLKLLETIFDEHQNVEIGIITPYAQQVADYKIDLESRSWNQVKVGTIHSFQGSECDIIIWDMVDTLNDSIGKLYKGETGERLVNVAISRTISKLFVVGNHRVFHEAQGRDSVTGRLKKVVSLCWAQAKGF